MVQADFLTAAATITIWTFSSKMTRLKEGEKRVVGKDDQRLRISLDCICSIDCFVNSFRMVLFQLLLLMILMLLLLLLLFALVFSYCFTLLLSPRTINTDPFYVNLQARRERIIFCQTRTANDFHSREWIKQKQQRTIIVHPQRM